MVGARDRAVRELLRSRGDAYTMADEIAVVVYGYDDRDSVNAVRALISNMRLRTPGEIESIPGIGYRLVSKPTVPVSERVLIARTTSGLGRVYHVVVLVDDAPFFASVDVQYQTLCSLLVYGLSCRKPTRSDASRCCRRCTGLLARRGGRVG